MRLAGDTKRSTADGETELRISQLATDERTGSPDNGDTAPVVAGTEARARGRHEDCVTQVIWRHIVFQARVGRPAADQRAIDGDAFGQHLDHAVGRLEISVNCQCTVEHVAERLHAARIGSEPGEIPLDACRRDGPVKDERVQAVARAAIGGDRRVEIAADIVQVDRRVGVGRDAAVVDCVAGQRELIRAHQPDAVSAGDGDGVVLDDGRLPAQAIGDDPILASCIEVVSDQGKTDAARRGWAAGWAEEAGDDAVPAYVGRMA